MPIVPYFFLLAQASTANQACERFIKFAESHPTLSLQVNISASDQGPGSGWIKIQRPYDAALDVKFAKQEYSARLAYPRCIEAVPSEKSYSFFDALPRMGFYNSRLFESFSNSGLDTLIQADGLKKDGWTLKSQVGGIDSIYRDRALTPTAGLRFEMDVDSEGRLVGQSLAKIALANGKAATGPDFHPVMIAETKFSGYSTAPIDFSTYPVEPQIGWQAEGLPTLADPLAPGRRVPNVTLKDPEGHSVQLADAVSGGAVLEILDPEWTVSDFGAEALKTVNAKFSKAGIHVIRMADSGTMPKSYSDPSGEVTRLLTPQGSPSFYWFGKDGQLKQVWFGCSPREPEQLYGDIDRKLKESSK